LILICSFFSDKLVPSINTPAIAACIPGQYQTYFSGTIINARVGRADELRAYFKIEEDPDLEGEDGQESASPEEPLEETVPILIGSTDDNPGRLNELNNELQL